MELEEVKTFWVFRFRFRRAYDSAYDLWNMTYENGEIKGKYRQEYVT